MAKRLLCLTCHQPMPAGMEYPPFIGREHTEFDLTSQEHVEATLIVLFDYLEAVCNVIPEAADISEEAVINLARLAADLTQEARRRAKWLPEARPYQYQTEKE